MLSAFRGLAILVLKGHGSVSTGYKRWFAEPVGAEGLGAMGLATV